MPLAAEMVRTLMPAASSGAIWARLVYLISRARGAANRLVKSLMIYCSAKGERVPEREIRASDLAVI
jgi:hypothetical protein